MREIELRAVVKKQSKWGGGVYVFFTYFGLSAYAIGCKVINQFGNNSVMLWIG